MRLSICIPVYNFDTRELVLSLLKEIDSNRIDAEIILIDDASNEAFRQINGKLHEKVGKVIYLEKNIGRARIRNLFLKYAEGDYLLFLDCDVRIGKTDFLQNYLAEIDKDPGLDLIYGNFAIAPQYSNSLRNRYSVKREIFPGDRSDDLSLFKTVNFIIKKSVFERFPFNEDLTEYGYEDFVFAKHLEQNHAKFLAINNPVIHLDDTANVVFLEKTEVGINTLFKLSKGPESKPLIKDIKVYRAAMLLKKLRLSSLFLAVYNLYEARIKSNLLSEHPRISFLDLYKLALILRKIK